jgi:hypothetical protein
MTEVAMTEPHVPGNVGEMGRSLGRLEANVAGIENRIERLELSSAVRMAGIEQKLDGVVQTLAQSLGAMKLMHWLGGALFAVLTLVATWFVHERG